MKSIKRSMMMTVINCTHKIASQINRILIKYFGHDCVMSAKLGGRLRTSMCMLSTMTFICFNTDARTSDMKECGKRFTNESD